MPGPVHHAIDDVLNAPTSTWPFLPMMRPESRPSISMRISPGRIVGLGLEQIDHRRPCPSWRACPRRSRERCRRAPRRTPRDARRCASGSSVGVGPSSTCVGQPVAGQQPLEISDQLASSSLFFSSDVGTYDSPFNFAGTVPESFRSPSFLPDGPGSSEPSLSSTSMPRPLWGEAFDRLLLHDSENRVRQHVDAEARGQKKHHDRKQRRHKVKHHFLLGDVGLLRHELLLNEARAPMTTGRTKYGSGADRSRNHRNGVW